MCGAALLAITVLATQTSAVRSDRDFPADFDTPRRGLNYSLWDLTIELLSALAEAHKYGTGEEHAVRNSVVGLAGGLFLLLAAVLMPRTQMPNTQ